MSARSDREVIEFPANPFVAFTDFLIVVLLILVLAMVHQLASSRNLVSRAAIFEGGDILRQSVNQGIADANRRMARSDHRYEPRQGVARNSDMWPAFDVFRSGVQQPVPLNEPAF